MVGMGKRHKGERGASLVEFALIMPLLVLLIFGMVDAGWAFLKTSRSDTEHERLHVLPPSRHLRLPLPTRSSQKHASG